jgi:hypothetical protein
MAGCPGLRENPGQPCTRVTARSSHAVNETQTAPRGEPARIVVVRGSARTQRHSMSLRRELGFLRSKQAADRWTQHALKERGPLQFAATITATLCVPLVFCSTPEALHHVIHAPSKGGARRKGRANRHVRLLHKSYQLSHPLAHRGKYSHIAASLLARRIIPGKHWVQTRPRRSEPSARKASASVFSVREETPRALRPAVRL